MGYYINGSGKYIIYNHWDMVITVHDTIDGHHRIVGFDVEPYSIAEGENRSLNDPTAEPDL